MAVSAEVLRDGLAATMFRPADTGRLGGAASVDVTGSAADPSPIPGVTRLGRGQGLDFVFPRAGEAGDVES